MCPYCKRGVTKDLQPVNNPNETLAQKMTFNLGNTDQVGQHYLNMAHERVEKKKSEPVNNPNETLSQKMTFNLGNTDQIDQHYLNMAHEREEKKKSKLREFTFTSTHVLTHNTRTTKATTQRLLESAPWKTLRLGWGPQTHDDSDADSPSPSHRFSQCSLQAANWD
ncbi:GL20891 [Drosophila persimilis]|uniref:GL20891 n=1 Tax=Drosophila persimilis TaxID=7234 RepID=B4H990_DROPE|nr:GL20891 [Drosophila persimilis]